jgi:hypothetical protein
MRPILPPRSRPRARHAALGVTALLSAAGLLVAAAGALAASTWPTPTPAYRRAAIRSGSAVPPAAAPSAPDTVRGLVFDSLAMEPLVDAFVLAEPGGASVTTDSLGRFTLVADAIVTRLTVYHDALDDAGIGALTLARPSGAAVWHDAVAATPSLATLWPSVCGDTMPEGDKRGILIGSARLPDDRTRVGGASVRAQWQEILPRTRLSQVEGLDAVTDSTGAYVLCGLPVTSQLAVLGASSALQTGALQLTLEERPLRKLDMVLAPVDGPIDRWPTITGRVLDPDGTPIGGAEVAIEGVDSVLVTDAEGRFAIRQAPPGSRMLAAQARGFPLMLQQVDVLFEDNPDVRVALARGLTIAGLEGVTVTERRVIRREREEFELRRQDGIATFVDTADVREFGSWRSALETVPGLEIRNAPGEEDPARFAVFGRGRNLGITLCTATLLVDGLPATLAEFHAIAPEQFLAAEIYRSEGYAPDRFGQFAEGDCALVIFWTFYGLRP